MDKLVFKIEYFSNDWTNGWLHQLTFTTNTGVSVPVFYAVKASPTQSYDVQLGINLTQTINNIQNYLTLSLSSRPAITGVWEIVREGNTLLIKIGNFVDVTATGDFGALSNWAYQANISTYYEQPPVELPNEPIGITPITTMSGNGFLINNDIWLGSPSFLDSENIDKTTKFKFYFNNLTNQKQSKEIIVYPYLGSGVKVNLSPVLKSLFEYPKAENNYTELTPFNISNIVNFFEIKIQRFFIPENSNVEIYDENTITKAFIRGGSRSNDSNLTLPIGTTLRPTQYLPIWNGYPVAEYKLATGYNIEKNNNLDSVMFQERMKVYGCSPTYLKFLNQKGGYSYWLFESTTNDEQGQGNEFANQLGEVVDFGKEYSNDIAIYSKVESKYLPLILDLIVSPEVLLYKGSNEWERVILSQNKVSENSFKRAYDVKLKLEKVVNFNSSLLW